MVRVFVLAVALCAATVLAQVDMQAPLTVSASGYGFTFALDGGDGNVVVASKPGGETPSVVGIGPIGSALTALSASVPLDVGKGHVTCGAIATVNGTRYLFAGLSAAGFVARVDLSFPAENGVKYLNASSAAFWGEGGPLSFVSVVVKGQYVLFGTKSAGDDNTVVRLDTADTNPSTRFRHLGSTFPGDLVAATQWGDDVMFTMTSEGPVPVTFYVISVVDFSLKATRMSSLTNFDLISGVAADFTTKRVVVGNGAGQGRVAVVNLSGTGSGTTESSVLVPSLSPITTFLVDTDARYAYVSLGNCLGSGLGFAAIRLVPSLAMAEQMMVDPGQFNCTESGVFTSSVLVKTPGDTDLSPGPRRKVIVFTEAEHEAGEVAPTETIMVAFSVYPAGACPSDCYEAEEHGECAGGACHCMPAWSGDDCSGAVPCAGTNCNDHGDCVSGQCVCATGWTGEFCDTVVTCPQSCSGRGTCEAGVCHCSEGYTGSGCELRTQGCGSLNDCSAQGTCHPGYPVGTCECSAGFTGNDCSEIDHSCTNCTNGVCSQGTCICRDGWEGPYCSRAVSECPNACSNHGVCRYARCTCFHGYMGLDCSQADLSYCGVNGCSGHGSCVDGICVCEPGWKGQECTVRITELSVGTRASLLAGENDASGVFMLPNLDQVVVCTRSTPGRCIALSAATLGRVRSSSFEDDGDMVLLEDAEGEDDVPKLSLTERLANALVPEFTAVSSVSMVQLSAAIGASPISVALADPERGFAILGTSANGNTTTHGQLLKISLTTFTRVAAIEFEDDSGKGVTAGVRAADGTFFFASGSNPARIYHVDGDLQILSTLDAGISPAGEVSALMFDDDKNVVAASGSTLFFYLLASGVFSNDATEVSIPAESGRLTAGFIANGLVIVGTDSSPATLLKLPIGGSATDLESLLLHAGENKVRSLTHTSEHVFVGLGADSSNVCFVAKVAVPSLVEVDMVDIKNCSNDLTAAAIDAEGDNAYFASAGSPAEVFVVRLTAQTACPQNCSYHGVCHKGQCYCSAGWAGSTCSVSASLCPKNCSRAGACINGVCHCKTGHFGDDCSVVALCRRKCAHGRCAGANGTWPCVCDHAWQGQFCDQPNMACPGDCSGHGACNHADGTCHCDAGFSGNDCATAPAPAANGTTNGTTDACASDADCGEHSVCSLVDDGTKRCVCLEGWSGDECQSYEGDSALSPAVIGVLVALALVLGMVAGVAIWKSWAGSSSSSAGLSPMAGGGGGGSRVGGGGYTRIPRRLVK